MLPNFLVVGAAKAGTTSVYQYLIQHPQIYMSPIKEPYFFSFIDSKPAFKGPYDDKTNKTIVTKIEDYEKLFENVVNEKAIGECSNSYLYFKYTAENIRKMIPACKIIVILRNPADRAYSHYLQSIMLGHEKLSFKDALQNERVRKEKNWRWHYQYIGQSMYYEQVLQYYNCFGGENVKIFLFEELINAPMKLMENIFEFLRVDSSFEPVTKKHNATGLPKNNMLHKFLSYDNWIKNITRPFTSSKLRGMIYKMILSKNYNYKNKTKLDDGLKKELKLLFKEDIIKLEKLTNRDLSNWLK